MLSGNSRLHAVPGNKNAVRVPAGVPRDVSKDSSVDEAFVSSHSKLEWSFLRKCVSSVPSVPVDLDTWPLQKRH